MEKRAVFVLAFLLLTNGVPFADDVDKEIALPQNTITVDVAPLAYYLVFEGILNLFSLGFLSTNTFGIAAQYERQITEKASMAGRAEYGIVSISGDQFKWIMSSVSAEIHGRYYPAQKFLFLRQ